MIPDVIGLAVEGMRVLLGDRTVVDGVSLVVGEGRLLALVGPNGSGKSTLLRGIYRAVKATGQVHVGDGRDLFAMRRREMARWVAATAQETPDGAGMTAREAISLGRLPYSLDAVRETAHDRDAINTAAARTDSEQLLDRDLATLSGGERQRVHLARALAQQTPVLLLDEPTNHLDIAHQLAALDLVSSLEVTAVAALHDLCLAAQWCDTMAVLSAGRLVALGEPRSVLTPALLGGVFGVAGRWIDLDDGQPRLLIDPLAPGG